MKNLLILIGIVSLLSACASQPAYRPAKNGGQGYSEQKVTSDRYRIQFKSYASDVAQTTNFVLLRAAQVTQEQGYDWFVVTSRETFVESQRVEPSSSIGVAHRREVVRDCGLLGCQTRSRPANEIGVSINAGNRDSKEVQAILEIRMGKGTRPETDSYHAQELIDNLQASTEK